MDVSNLMTVLGSVQSSSHIINQKDVRDTTDLLYLFLAKKFFDSNKPVSRLEK